MDQTPLPPPIMPPAPSRREHFKSIISTVLILLAAPLVALLLTAFVFQSYQVDGPSMESTLNDNDRLIVLKLGKTWSRLTNKSYIPARGEIIIFNGQSSEDTSSGIVSGKQLIKRVAALPGERVVVSGGKVTVYSDANPSGFDPDAQIPAGNIIGTTSGNVDLTVPASEVFVLGDNRENSLDSRAFGTVPSSDIVGKLVLRIFPFNKIQSF